MVQSSVRWVSEHHWSDVLRSDLDPQVGVPISGLFPALSIFACKMLTSTGSIQMTGISGMLQACVRQCKNPLACRPVTLSGPLGDVEGCGERQLLPELSHPALRP